MDRLAHLDYYVKAVPREKIGITLPGGIERVRPFRERWNDLLVGVDTEKGVYLYYFHPTGIVEVCDLQVLRETDHQLPIFKLISGNAQGLYGLASLLKFPFDVARVSSGTMQSHVG